MRGVDAGPLDRRLFPISEDRGASEHLVAHSLSGKPRKNKVSYGVVGLAPKILYKIHNQNQQSMVRGMLERLFYVKRDGVFVRPPRPRKGIYHERLGYLAERISCSVSKTTPIAREDFPGLYEGRRRTVYESALKSLYVTPVSARDAKIKAFGKVEKINFSAKPDPAPRMIYPRSPRYNLEVGRYIKPLEPRLCKAVASVFGGVTITKGLTAEGVGDLIHTKWSKFCDPVAVGLDASRFDQHVSQEALSWEHSLYARCFKNPGPLQRLLRMQLVNRGHWRLPDGYGHFSVQGGRMSGDMNTGLGNCIIASCLVKAYCDAKNIQFELVNNGDDCVVIMQRSSLSCFNKGLDEWFLEMGFNMVVELPVYHIEHIRFCQAAPVFDGECWVMVRDPHTSLAKDCVSLRSLSTESEYKQWIKAVGLAGGAMAGGIPVVAAFYQRLVDAGGDIDLGGIYQSPQFETGMMMLARGMTRRGRIVTDDARLSFWRAFGITPDQQVDIEAHLATVDISYYDDQGEFGEYLPTDFTPIWFPPSLAA